MANSNDQTFYVTKDGFPFVTNVSKEALRAMVGLTKAPANAAIEQVEASKDDLMKAFMEAAKEKATNTIQPYISPMSWIKWLVGCDGKNPALCAAPAAGGRRKTRRKRRRRRKTRRKRRRRRKTRRKRRRRRKRLGRKSYRKQRGGGCSACLALALL